MSLIIERIDDCFQALNRNKKEMIRDSPRREIAISRDKADPRMLKMSKGNMFID